jgi:hypothetical protein
MDYLSAAASAVPRPCLRAVHSLTIQVVAQRVVWEVGVTFHAPRASVTVPNQALGGLADALGWLVGLPRQVGAAGEQVKWVTPLNLPIMQVRGTYLIIWSPIQRAIQPSA